MGKKSVHEKRKTELKEQKKTEQQTKRHVELMGFLRNTASVTTEDKKRTHNMFTLGTTVTVLKLHDGTDPETTKIINDCIAAIKKQASVALAEEQVAPDSIQGDKTVASVEASPATTEETTADNEE
jgi:hypothetical protein